MLKRVAVIAAGLFAVLLLVIATRPGHLHVERSLAIAAPPAVVFPLINDFHAWPSWSPWEKLDPNMKREIGGQPSGKGALYSWSGNDQVGVGSMEITDSSEPSQVKIRLEFKQPWAATNATTFSLVPTSSPAASNSPAAPAGTHLTWAMDGENNFGAKAMGMFMNMDEMIGKDFEAGLTNLGAIAEASAEQARATAAKPAEPTNGGPTTAGQ